MSENKQKVITAFKIVVNLLLLLTIIIFIFTKHQVTAFGLLLFIVNLIVNIGTDKLKSKLLKTVLLGIMLVVLVISLIATGAVNAFWLVAFMCFVAYCFDVFTE